MCAHVCTCVQALVMGSVHLLDSKCHRCAEAQEVPEAQVPGGADFPREAWLGLGFRRGRFFQW